jgi:hypothetical protein
MISEIRPMVSGCLNASMVAPSILPMTTPGALSRRGFLSTTALASASLGAVGVLGVGCGHAPPAAAPASAKPAERDAWQPARTFAFFVGLVEFANPETYEPFDVKERRDRELFERLIGRGVPASQATFLDGRAATLSAIRAALGELLVRTRPGDTLWLHYSGHGTRTDDGAAYFAPFDATGDVATCWSVTAIFDAIEREFHGIRALLSADCCHSGSLAREAAGRRGAIGYGCITSSLSRESSTGAWTFTECLLDAIAGEPELDLDGDGVVRFEEVGRYAEAELAFVEGQLTQFAATGGFPARMALAATGGRATRRERVEVCLEGRSKATTGSDEDWSRAHLLERDAGRARVRLVDDDDKSERWVDAADVRPWRPTTLARGAEVDVAPEGDEGEDAAARPAHVLDARLGVHLVRYFDDREGLEDEWIPGWRLTEREPEPSGRAPD